MDSLIELKNRFLKIKKMGWHKSIRKGSTGIGATFEYLLGKSENDLEIPDFLNIEIKTKRHYSNSFTTLFNYTPNGLHYHEVERLRKKYGYPSSILKEYLVLHNSVFCDKTTLIGNKYYFMTKIDRIKQKIYLLIFDKNMNLIEDNIHWDFDILKEKLYRKLKIIGFIDTYRKYVNNEEYFYYYKLIIYRIRNFDIFIKLIEDGIIRISFKIDVFYKERRKGQIHDHGTGFDIKKRDIEKLYYKYKTII